MRAPAWIIGRHANGVGRRPEDLVGFVGCKQLGVLPMLLRKSRSPHSEGVDYDVAMGPGGHAGEPACRVGERPPGGAACGVAAHAPNICLSLGDLAYGQNGGDERLPRQGGDSQGGGVRGGVRELADPPSDSDDVVGDRCGRVSGGSFPPPLLE